MRSEGFYINKNPLTLTGIEPATFRIVAQHLNHCATRKIIGDKIKLFIIYLLYTHYIINIFCIRLSTYIILLYHCAPNTGGCPLTQQNKRYSLWDEYVSLKHTVLETVKHSYVDMRLAVSTVTR